MKDLESARNQAIEEYETQIDELKHEAITLRAENQELRQ
jgi:ribosomal protein L29